MTAPDPNPFQSTVLVVLDDAGARDRCIAWLRDLGVDARGVATPQAALDAARADKPALIVVDFGVAGMDGWELLRELHADANLAATPVMVMSGVEGPSGDLVVEGYVLAPFVPAGSDDLVQTILGRAPIQRVA